MSDPIHESSPFASGDGNKPHSLPKLDANPANLNQVDKDDKPKSNFKEKSPSKKLLLDSDDGSKTPVEDNAKTEAYGLKVKTSADLNTMDSKGGLLSGIFKIAAGNDNDIKENVVDTGFWASWAGRIRFLIIFGQCVNWALAAALPADENSQVSLPVGAWVTRDATLFFICLTLIHSVIISIMFTFNVETKNQKPFSKNTSIKVVRFRIKKLRIQFFLC
jgi:hypothetical protein